MTHQRWLLWLIAGFGVMLCALETQAQDLPTIKLKSVKKVKLDGPAYSVAAHPHQPWIAVGLDKSILLTHLDGSKLHTWNWPAGQVRGISFSPDGSTLAAGSYQSVQLLKVNAGTDGNPTLEPLKTLPGHRGYVLDLAWSPDGKRLATACDDEAARVFLVETAQRQFMLIDHGFPVTSVAWSPSGEWLATSAGDETRAFKAGEVFLREATTGEVLHKLTGFERPVLAIQFTPQSDFLICGGLDEKCFVFQTKDGQPLGFYGGHARPVRRIVTATSQTPRLPIAITGSGGRFAGKNETHIWTVDSGDQLALDESHTSQITGVALSPSANRMITVGRDQTAQISDVQGLQAQPGLSVSTLTVPKPNRSPEAKWPPPPAIPCP